MSWSTVKEAVRVAVATALEMEDYVGGRGTPVPRVEWEGKSSSHRYQQSDQGQWADLRINNVVARGHDETRYEVVEGATDALTRNVPTYGGYRLFTVVVSIGSDSQEDDAEAVGTLAGKLRTRLRRQDVRAGLKAANVAIVSIGQTIEADYLDQEQRVISRSFTELRLATTEQDTDSDSDGDFVASAEGEGTLTDGVTDRVVPFDTAD